MLNAATIAAIVAACWAHPSGVAYLAKIEQIRACAEARGNPCCVTQEVYGGRQAKHITKPSIEHILESWEWLEQQRTQQVRDAPDGIIQPKPAPVAQVIPAAPVAAETAQILSAQIHTPVAADSVALAALQRRNRMAMILVMALDDDDD